MLNLETTGLVGNFSVLSFGDNFYILPVPQNLPGEDPVGYKREYYCNDMFALAFLNTLWVFVLIYFVGSLFNFTN